MGRIYLSPPHIGDDERELVMDALDSNWVAPLGPHVDAFEQEVAAMVGVPHAVALSSGTAALHLALILLDVGPGDEVIVPTLTFVASANVVTYVGATPVFVDCDAATWNLSPDLLDEVLDERARRGAKPKAVLSVDLYGQCADYDRIEAACARHDVPLVADAAEALGATYRGRAAGSFGRLGAFSFNGNKIITTSGGGMLVGRDEEELDRARFLATQAREPAAHYEHAAIGFNYRMSNVLAAIGRAQLRRLPERIAVKRATAELYREALADVPGITFAPVADYGEPNWWLTCVLIDAEQFGASREDVRLHLEELDIESRPTWKPMHLQPVFADREIVGGAVSAQIFERGLCLPSGSALTAVERDRVAQGVLAARSSQPQGRPQRR